MASTRTATPVKPRAAIRAVDAAMARRLLAEGLGTAFLTLIGCGAVTVTQTLDAKNSLAVVDLGIIALGFGLAIAIAIYAIGRVSGGHINPAVTIGMLVTRRIEPLTAVYYIVAQLVGAAVAGFALIAIYGSAAAKTTSLGVTSFGASTTPLQAAIVEAIGTFVFVYVITAMAADSRAPSGWAGLVIGLTLAAIILLTGTITGGSLNPARSFGPELVKGLYGGKPDWGQYWVYVVGPVVGAVVAVFAYDFVANNKRGK